MNARKGMPLRPLRGLLALCVPALCLLAVACRDDGLADQPKAGPYEPSAVLPGGTVAQPPPPGSVARAAPGRATGAARREGAEGLSGMALLARGRERFAIFCQPCHGADGRGRGEVVQRGFPAPPSLHEARLRAAPAAHIRHVIAQGIGAMYPYGARVPPADRRAIAAYVRALQLARGTDAVGDRPAEAPQ